MKEIFSKIGKKYIIGIAILLLMIIIIAIINSIFFFGSVEDGIIIMELVAIDNEEQNKLHRTGSLQIDIENQTITFFNYIGKGNQKSKKSKLDTQKLTSEEIEEIKEIVKKSKKIRPRADEENSYCYKIQYKNDILYTNKEQTLLINLGYLRKFEEYI